MAMPKKGTRRITVEGQAYRWSSRLKGGSDDLTVTIQSESGAGSLLIIKAQHTDPYYRLSIETGGAKDAEASPPDELRIASPAFARAAILFARADGWDPASEAKPRVLRYADEGFLRKPSE